MNNKKKLEAPCPTCQNMTSLEQDNPFRPFCQKRCKLIDLGNWANESYTIPSEEPADEEDIERNQRTEDN